MIRGFGSSEVRIGVRTMRCQPSLRDLEVVGVLFPSLERLGYCRSSLRDAVSVAPDRRIFTACAPQSER